MLYSIIVKKWSYEGGAKYVCFIVCVCTIMCVKSNVGSINFGFIYVFQGLWKMEFWYVV